MAYIPHTDEDVRAMLDAIGIESIDELFASLPSDIRLKRPLDLPPAMSEWELTRHMNLLSSQNRHAGDTVCFLGGGAYDHFIPAVVDFVASRSEFYTSYTPYQPEVAQGNLQAFFEYQTLITQLTGMDISNASMYDGASATVEAVVMALSAARGRNRVILPDSLHPDYRQVVATYLANLDVELVSVPAPEGRIATDALTEALNDKTACVVLQHPNFFGCLEDADLVSKATHEAGALLVAVVDPVSLGILRRPSEYGADIVVAEGQPLGIPLGFGGPYLGIMACREQFVRRMPGRLVGQTVDRRGKRCWVLTLQTREQHIRREKATSNICTNQGLLALRATVFLATLGKPGIRQMAESCARNAHYAKTQIAQRTSWTPAFAHPTFKEFVIRAGSREKLEAATARAADEGIFAGTPLARWLPDMDDALLIAVTEKRTQAEIDRLAACLQ
ncbi:MAG: aminomethyl-transferring glycine dehydrogenase subunit GcvPA [Planctomycetota bacterium]|nr:MAG: aminomethyl-transferring glycine dehydrogenase subunit GcvPA [Planctomycetota bacterium]